MRRSPVSCAWDHQLIDTFIHYTHVFHVSNCPVWYLDIFGHSGVEHVLDSSRYSKWDAQIFVKRKSLSSAHRWFSMFWWWFSFKPSPIFWKSCEKRHVTQFFCPVMLGTVAEWSKTITPSFYVDHRPGWEIFQGYWKWSRTQHTPNWILISWLSIYLYIYPPIHSFIYLSIHPYIHPSIYPSIHSSIYLSIHPPIYRHTHSKCSG